jgi:hypothetical protein
MIQQLPEEANKASLETEKERDELHNQIEQIEEHRIRREHTLMMMMVMLMKTRRS